MSPNPSLGRWPRVACAATCVARGAKRWHAGPVSDSEAFTDLVELLASADFPEDRRAAVVMAIENASTEFAAWLRRRAHLLARGGNVTLLREAMADSSVRALAERHLHGSATSRPLVHRVATTRSGPGAQLTIETGLHPSHAAFTSGAGIDLFGGGSLGGLSVDPDGDGHASGWFVRFTANGERTFAHRIGLPREDNGAFAVSPDNILLAVRYWRDIAIHDLSSGDQLRTLSGVEGPTGLWFVDMRRLLALDGSTLMLWDVVTGDLLAREDSVGSGALALSPDRRHVVVGGCWGLPHALHSLPSLRIAATFAGHQPGSPMLAQARNVTGAVAFSPSGLRVATGNWHHEVCVFEVGDLLAETDDAAVVIGPARHLSGSIFTGTGMGAHRQWVDAVAFVDEDRVVSGGWDGQVLLWDIRKPGPPVHLGQHAGYVTAVDVSADGLTVLSCASDGTAKIWAVADDCVAPPPYAFRYGGSGDEVRMTRSGPALIDVTVGDQSGSWTSGGYPGPRHDSGTVAGDHALSAFPSLGLYVTWEAEPRDPGARRFRVHDDTDVVVDEVQVEADLVVSGAVDGDTLAVVEEDGHISFWRIGT